MNRSKQHQLQQNRGIFITLEGGEGSGKSTVLEGLYASLSEKGHSVIKTREPGGTRLGEEVRSLLLNKKEYLSVGRRAELLLFLSARAQHVEELIAPSLEAGKIVLCDRFHDSSIAYQGIARDLGEEEVRKITLFSSYELVPNLTLLFDIDPKIGLKRSLSLGSFDRIENESLTFHETVRAAFLALAKKEPNRIVIIDASQEKIKVFNDALKAVGKVVGS